MSDPAKRTGRYCGSKHDHPPHEWASHLVGAPPEGYPRDCPGKPRRKATPAEILVPLDVLRALKTMMQDGLGYELPDTKGPERCAECGGVAPDLGGAAVHDESDGPCIVRVAEDFFEKHPEIQGDLDEIFNRGAGAA